MLLMMVCMVVEISCFGFDSVYDNRCVHDCIDTMCFVGVVYA